MPELPEVETVRRTLALTLIGETISNVDVIYPKIIQQDVNRFQEKIKNQTIRKINRMGKYLIFILDEDVMIIHLRMEGKFFIKTNEEVLKHEHVIFHFLSGRELRYHDVRKFGTIDFLPIETYLSSPPLMCLGKEPKDIDLNVFYSKLQVKKVPIKVALLDQHMIAGLGNIYVDETLYKALIHPNRSANSVSLEETKRILNSAIEVLDQAVLLGGTTIRSYTSSLGVHGRFQNELNVHMKKGEPCKFCQTEIIKMRVGGRGTYVCPKCQK
jgi:formamidopyrimidine-DNA glycosylase